MIEFEKERYRDNHPSLGIINLQCLRLHVHIGDQHSNCSHREAGPNVARGSNRALTGLQIRSAFPYSFDFLYTLMVTDEDQLASRDLTRILPPQAFEKHTRNTLGHSCIR